MKKLLFVLVVFISMSLQAQKKYRAIYEMKMNFNSNTLKIQHDSLMDGVTKDMLSDSATNAALNDALLEAAENLLGGGVAVIITVNTIDDKNNIIRMQDSKDSKIKMDPAEDGVPYLNNGYWVKPNPENNKLDTLKNSWSISKFTGNKKMISGYECEEIELMKDSKDIGLAWICRELPNSINPFIPINNSQGAVLEYSTKDQKTTYILKELKLE
jgi:hypothetical protein